MLDGSNYGCSHLHFTGPYCILRCAKLPTSYHELFAKVPRIKCNSHLSSTSFQRNPPYLLLLLIVLFSLYSGQFFLMSFGLSGSVNPSAILQNSAMSALAQSRESRENLHCNFLAKIWR